LLLLLFFPNRDVIKGNNLTQCYIEATGGCAGGGTQTPTPTMQSWERVMQDLYQLCDGGMLYMDQIFKKSELVVISTVQTSNQSLTAV
jgi:hypothetical protein